MIKINSRSRSAGLRGLQGRARTQLRYFVYCRKSEESDERQVMSLPAQKDEIVRRFTSDAALDIVGVVEEARSAKTPGRPEFGRMLDAIEAGEAEGIIAWAPDRLARNAVDDGRVVDLLDRALLLDLKFCTYTFENNAQGKFMLQIAFAQAKHYSDNLSDVIVRGNRAKVERGWAPNGARHGYKNCKETLTTIPDPDRFLLIRQMFTLMLTGTYRPAEICRIANDEWGFRTRTTARGGGGPIAVSTFYRMLSNPFYAGVIVWRGAAYPGKHVPLITLGEYDRVQVLLGRKTRERPQRHTFPFTGFIKCPCGLTVTAEHKTNRQGKRYTYYHCSRRMSGPRCTEPAVQAGVLEVQIVRFLERLSLNSEIEQLIFANLEREQGEREVTESKQTEMRKAARALNEKQTKTLTSLRLRELLNDEEFQAERARLLEERLRLDMQFAAPKSERRFSPLQDLQMFSKYAAKWFAHGDDNVKRLIVKTVGSHPVLAQKILRIKAAKPFEAMNDLGRFLIKRRRREDVLTQPEYHKLVEALYQALDDPAFAGITETVRLMSAPRAGP